MAYVKLYCSCSRVISPARARRVQVALRLERLAKRRVLGHDGPRVHELFKRGGLVHGRGNFRIDQVRLRRAVQPRRARRRHCLLRDVVGDVDHRRLAPWRFAMAVVIQRL